MGQLQLKGGGSLLGRGNKSNYSNCQIVNKVTENTYVKRRSPPHQNRKTLFKQFKQTLKKAIIMKTEKEETQTVDNEQPLKENEITHISFDSKNDCIVFYRGEEDYKNREDVNSGHSWIPLKDLSSNGKILRVVFHLSSKQWFTSGVLNSFIELLKIKGLYK